MSSAASYLLTMVPRWLCRNPLVCTCSGRWQGRWAGANVMDAMAAASAPPRPLLGLLAGGKGCRTGHGEGVTGSGRRCMLPLRRARAGGSGSVWAPGEDAHL